MRKVRNLRILVVLAGAVAMLMVFGGHLAIIQLLDYGTLHSQALAERLHRTVLPAQRGEILGRHGRVLATDEPADAVWADTYQVPHPAATALRLSRVLPLPASQLQSLLTPKRGFVYLDLQIGTRRAQAVRALKLPGIYLQQETRRYYPNGNLAAPLLGFTGAENQGLAGVEFAEQRYLAGQPGVALQEYDAAGNPMPQFYHRVVPPVPGDNVELTLDSTIEEFAQSALAKTVKKWHAASGRILVMDPRTGAVLALADWPTFDPNHWASYPPALRGDPLVQDSYPPGSTFKPVTLSAALQEGVVSPSAYFNDPGYKVVSGVTLHEWNGVGFGHISLAQALAYSSDVAFTDIGLSLGTQRLYKYIQAFGLTQPTGVGLPGEASGVILPESQVRPIDLADMSFGQSLTLTPLQLLNAISAIANGGRLMQPRVVRAVIAPDGKVIHRFSARAVRQVVSPQVAAEVTSMMEDVIKYGTGTPAQIPGYVLAGKTGTSNLVINGRLTNIYMGSFIGFGPIPNPRLAMLVQIYKPHGAFYGDIVAAPTWAKVMQESLRYLGVPPNVPPVSSGRAAPTSAVVPDLAGLTPAQASRLLTARGLRLLVAGQGPTVLSQRPSAGAGAAPGSGVLVETSRNITSVQVPNLTGLSMRQAADLLSALHLGFVPTGSGLASAQTPKAGATAAVGTPVRVTFAAPP
ncbi:MAG: penicillin-binding transpeptidase domain-containing protein [Thermaerobacter sp.]|nr:penicillin-binding transpeptidase domain-containing protein [Thermaerobacter sp.]